MSCWWVCTVLNPDGSRCFDRMALNVDPRKVERDRDAHLWNWHQGATIEPRLLCIVYSHEPGETGRVKV